MKKIIITLSVLAGVALAGYWFNLSLHAKSQWDQMAKELVTTYAVTPMDQPTEAYFEDVKSNWFCQADNIGGPHSEGVKLAGMTPSVSNLMRILNYQMPEYSWLSPGRNRKAVVMGLVKGELTPISLDRTIHVSQDRHTAVIRCAINVVYVFRDETDGMRETLYFRKKQTSNQVPEDTARKLADPQH